MKTIGIIGGFSPEATALLYTKLTSLARRKKTPSQPHILISNVALPFALEQKLLVEGKGLARVRPLVIAAARELVAAGADCVVLPCNTLHVLSRDIQTSISVPFVDIVSASIGELRRLDVSSVGLLGSGITLQSHIFSDPKIRFHLPPQHTRTSLTNAIHASVRGASQTHLRQLLRRSAAGFKTKGISDVLLACTDFSGVCTSVPGVRLHDTLTILAQKTFTYTDFKKEGFVVT